MRKQFITGIFLAIFIISADLHAQHLKFGQPQPMTKKRTSSIENTAGIHNNDYMVVETDFGNGFQISSIRSTYITKYNLKTLKTSQQVLMNAQMGEGINESAVAMIKMFQWQNRIVGFYTLKGRSTNKSYPGYARFFDGDLKPLGSSIELGPIYHGMEKSGYFANKDLAPRLTFREDFWYRFSPDSSVFLLVMPIKDKSENNLLLRFFDKDLKQTSEKLINVPIRNKSVALTDIKVTNQGIVYLLTRTKKDRSDRKASEDDDDWFVEMHRLDEKGAIKTADLNTVGKSLIEPKFTFDGQGRPTVVCMYHELKRGKEMAEAHGIYTAKYDPASLKFISQHSQEFNNDILLLELYEKGIKDGYGMTAAPFIEYILRPDGGIYAVAQVVTSGIIEKGTTGALNRSVTSIGNTYFCLIDAEGKIRWTKPLTVNPGSAGLTETSLKGAMYIFGNNMLTVLTGTFREVSKDQYRYGLVLKTIDDSGKITEGDFNQFPDGTQGYRFVPSTFCQISENQYVACVHLGVDRYHKEADLMVLRMDF